jgi:hypothetical protein
MVDFVWYIVLFCTYLYIIVFFWLLMYFYCTAMKAGYGEKIGFIVNSAMKKIAEYGFFKRFGESS